jgi:hypothetical protein
VVVGAGAGAGAVVAFGVRVVRRGVTRDVPTFAVDASAPASATAFVEFGSTISGSLGVSVDGLCVPVVGTAIAIGALEETGSALPLEPPLRSAYAIPPPMSAATRITAIQTPIPMPPADACDRGGGTEGRFVA